MSKTTVPRPPAAGSDIAPSAYRPTTKTAVCSACGTAAYVADSAEHAGDADLQFCDCPCGAGTFAVAVGFTRRSDHKTRWVSTGPHCLTDGTLGVHADWKIDYSPTSHLLTCA